MSITATETVAATLNVTRDATAEDAQQLQAIYLEGKELTKRWKALNQRSTNDISNLVTPEEIGTEAAKCHEIRCNLRDRLKALPKGTVARGGVTRQAVWMPFGGRVCPELGKQMTTSDAKKVCKAAYGS